GIRDLIVTGVQTCALPICVMRTAKSNGLPKRRTVLWEGGIPLNRRGFLRTALQGGALLAAPQIVRGAVLGKDGGVAPSERIVLRSEERRVGQEGSRGGGGW